MREDAGTRPVPLDDLNQLELRFHYPDERNARREVLLHLTLDFPVQLVGRHHLHCEVRWNGHVPLRGSSTRNAAAPDEGDVWLAHLRGIIREALVAAFGV